MKISEVTTPTPEQARIKAMQAQVKRAQAAVKQERIRQQQVKARLHVSLQQRRDTDRRGGQQRVDHAAAGPLDIVTGLRFHFDQVFFENYFSEIVVQNRSIF